jgi:hypothetical protein
MKIIYIVFLFFTFTSCERKEHIYFVVNNINKCSEGSNQIEIDEKAFYDKNSKVLIIYIGRNHNISLKKWEIPITELSPKSIYYENKDFPCIITSVPNGLKKIKYYENNMIVDSLDFISYPIHDYCLNEKEIESFLNQYKQAVIEINN